MKRPESLLPARSTNPSRWYRSSAQQERAGGSSELGQRSSLPRGRRMDDAAWVISSRLIAGIVLYTGIGWLLSLWLGHRELLMAVGALFGLGLSYYLIFTGLAREERQRLAAQATSKTAGRN
jgi:ATP synthase protein I